MPTDPRGRWFRVYPRQVRQHDKFRSMTAAELGSWLALRSEAELRDGFVIADRDEALLILRRRHTPKPREMLDTMLGLHLFDELADGSIAVHDRDDHDRPRYPSDDPEEVRRRKQAERDRKRGGDGGHEVTTRDALVTRDSHEPRARDSQQSQHADTAFSLQPAEPAPDPAGLPTADDPVTEACRLLPNGGRMLGDADYRAAFDDMVRRFSAEWVNEALTPAYAWLVEQGKGIRPWDLKRRVEWILAERVRAEEVAAAKRQSRRNGHADAEHRRRVAAATPEQREQAAYQKRAISLGLSMKVEVPTDPAEVRAFVLKHEPGFTAEARAGR
jgi:hypothetical protein